MGSLGRKLRRSKELQDRKNAKKMMRSVNRQLANEPKSCGECGALFDNTEKDMLNKWRVAVYDDGRVNLACPSCSEV